MPMHQLSTIPIDAELLIDDFQRRVVEAYEAEFERLVEHAEQVELQALSRVAYGHLMQPRAPQAVQPRVGQKRSTRYTDASCGLHGNSRRRADYKRSLIWEHVGTLDVLRNPNNEFNNLTRIPRDIFDDIVQAAADSGKFDVSVHEPLGADLSAAAAKRAKAELCTPLVLKIFCVLRHLATGEPFSSVGLAAHISGDVIKAFFHNFLSWFVDRFYAEKVVGPSGFGFETKDDVENAEKIFRQLGMPGICTSMDAVHVAWDRAPYTLKWMYVGKEGYATLAWNCHVINTTEFAYVAPAHPGAANDKTLVRYDKLVQALQTNPIFTDREWRIHDEQGERILKGTSALCDGGYHRWSQTICGYKHAVSAAEIKFSSRCESVRKNVERAFGILKARHRCLRLPVLFHGDNATIKIDTMFKTCVILHNWLLRHSKADSIGQEAHDWAEISPDAKRARERIYSLLNGEVIRHNNRPVFVHDNTDFSLVGSQCADPNFCPQTGQTITTEHTISFDERRAGMVQHFDVCSRPCFDTQGGRFDQDVPKWPQTRAQVCRLLP